MARSRKTAGLGQHGHRHSAIAVWPVQRQQIVLMQQRGRVVAALPAPERVMGMLMFHWPLLARAWPNIIWPNSFS